MSPSWEPSPHIEHDELAYQDGPDRGSDVPAFERLPGGGYVHRLQPSLAIEVRYLRRDRGLHAEVDVRCTWAGARTHNGSLSCSDLNLSSQQARRSFAKYCEERSRTQRDDGFDWMGAIDAASLLVIQAERQGDDPIVLDDAPTVADRDLDVYGLKVPADAASLLVAHGDSLKSFLTLLVLGTLARREQPVLYVDWEWSADRHRARKIRLFGTDRIPRLYYLRCRAPLVIECDRIRRFCDRHRITFIGIDSIGLACDGPLKDDDVAIRFHRALASLPASLCAAHVPKNATQADLKIEPTVFGSVYFSNLCRASWVVRKQPGATSDLVTVGLFPSKQNDGERTREVGLQFAFQPDRIEVQPVDLATVDGLAERLPLAVRIRHLLRTKPLSFAEIAERLDAKQNSVIQAVTRGRAFVKVQSADGIPRIALVERHLDAK